MNADSRNATERYDHYGMHNPLRHIITIGIAHESRNNLHFIKADDAISGDRFLHDADCWLIDAGNLSYAGNFSQAFDAGIERDGGAGPQVAGRLTRAN